MHFAAEVGGPAEAAIIQEPDGEFRIQTQKHEYPLDVGKGIEINIIVNEIRKMLR